jgi:hypothetical protein
MLTFIAFPFGFTALPSRLPREEVCKRSKLQITNHGRTALRFFHGFSFFMLLKKTRPPGEPDGLLPFCQVMTEKERSK